jgi:protein TonB
MNARWIRRAATLVLAALAFACGAWTDAAAQRRPARRAAKRVTKRATKRAATTKRRTLNELEPIVIMPAPRKDTTGLHGAGVVAGPPVADDTGEPTRPPGASSASGSRTISGGVLNGKAISKPAPVYPAIARAAGAQGSVTVQITVDEEGNVISAVPVSGHPLLQQSAVSAVRQWKFTPTRLSGQPVKVAGVVVVNYTLQ